MATMIIKIRSGAIREQKRDQRRGLIMGVRKREKEERNIMTIFWKDFREREKGRDRRNKCRFATYKKDNEQRGREEMTMIGGKRRNGKKVLEK